MFSIRNIWGKGKISWVKIDYLIQLFLNEAFVKNWPFCKFAAFWVLFHRVFVMYYFVSFWLIHNSLYLFIPSCIWNNMFRHDKICIVVKTILSSICMESWFCQLIQFWALRVFLNENLRETCNSNVATFESFTAICIYFIFSFRKHYVEGSHSMIAAV